MRKGRRSSTPERDEALCPVPSVFSSHAGTHPLYLLVIYSTSDLPSISSYISIFLKLPLRVLLSQLYSPPPPPSPLSPPGRTHTAAAPHRLAQPSNVPSMIPYPALKPPKTRRKEGRRAKRRRRRRRRRRRSAMMEMHASASLPIAYRRASTVRRVVVWNPRNASALCCVVAERTAEVAPRSSTSTWTAILA